MTTTKNQPITGALQYKDNTEATAVTNGRIGNDGASTYRLSFPVTLPTLPGGAVITKATLTLGITPEATVSGTLPRLGLYCGERLIDYEPMPKAAATVRMDVTPMADAAAAGEAVTLTLRSIDETVTGTAAVALSSLALTLEYEVSYGQKTFGATESTLPVGHRMSGTVDVRRGVLLLAFDDVDVGTPLLPFTLRHYYNSALANYRYTQNTAIGLHTANYEATQLGRGWRLNTMQSVVAYSDAEGSFYVYTDEYGDEHRLDGESPSDPTVGTYDPDTRILMRGDTAYRFDWCGRLAEISKDGESITITYCPDADHILSISNSAGGEYSFFYTPYYLDRITDSQGISLIRYSYYRDRLNYVYYHADASNGRYPLERLSYDNATSTPTEIRHRLASGADLDRHLFTFEDGRLTAAHWERRVADEEFLPVTTTTYANAPALGECYRTVTTYGEDGATVTGTATSTYSYTYAGEELGRVVTSGGSVTLSPVDTGTALLSDTFESGGWETENGALVTANGLSTPGALALNGTLDTLAVATRDVSELLAEAVAAGHAYTATVRAKADAVPDRDREGTERPILRMRALLTLRNGETLEKLAPLSTDTAGWQYAKLVIDERSAPIMSARLYLEYGYSSGTALFDDLRLTRLAWNAPALSAPPVTSDDRLTAAMEKHSYAALGGIRMSVNLPLGLLSLSFADVQLSDETHPLALSHRYLPTGITPSGRFGKFFVLSAESRIQKSGSESFTTGFLFIDGGGIRHTMRLDKAETDENGTVIARSGYCTDTRGLYCEVDLTAEAPDYVIKDAKGNALHFDPPPSGRLRYAVDTSGNRFNYLYNTSGRLERITKGSDAEATETAEATVEPTLVTLAYTEDGLLASVTDQNGRVTAYTYSGDYLTAVCFGGEYTVSLYYDSRKRLSVIEDDLGSCRTVTYEPDSHRVLSVATYMTREILGDTPLAEPRLVERDTYHYASGATSVTTRHGVTTVHLYDGKHQPLLDYEPATAETVAEGDVFSLRRYVPDPIPGHEGECFPYGRESLTASGVPLAYDENGNTASAELLPTASDFDSAETGTALPTGWQGTGLTTGDGVVEGSSLGEGKAYRLTGSAGEKALSMTVTLGEGSLYHHGLAFVAHVRRARPAEDGAPLRIELSVGDATDTCTLSPSLTDWQTAVAALPIVGTPTVATVRVVLSGVGGDVYLDALHLLSVPATSTLYSDASGDAGSESEPIPYARSVTASDGRYVTATYLNEAESPVLERLTDREGNTFDTVTVYDGQNRPVSMTDYRGRRTTFTYDAHGNVIREDLECENLLARTERAYSADGRFLEREYDPRYPSSADAPVFTEYEYQKLADGIESKLVARTMPNGLYYYNSYGATDRRLSRISLENEGYYSFAGDYFHEHAGLARVETGSSVYRFTYDGIGRRTAVTVDREDTVPPLNAVTYDDENRRETVRLGTGAENSVTLDAHGNPVWMTSYRRWDRDASTGINTEYDIFGRAVKRTDVRALDNSPTFEYNYYKYDRDGNLCRILGENGTLRLSNQYDAYGRLQAQSEYRTSPATVTSYLYDERSDRAIYPDARVAVCEVSAAGNVGQETLSYDWLGNLTERTLMQSGRTVLAEALTYHEYSDENSHVLAPTVTEHTLTYGAATETYDYTYDKNGNVTEITRGGLTVRRYAYDLLDRLVRADCADLGKTFVYDYDRFGNLLEKNACAYTLGEPDLNTAVSDVYTYGMSEWSDRLTAFNGESIVYDEIGNPTTYRGRALTFWGRKLENDGERTYAYRTDGARIRKGDTTYVVEGGRILGETTGSETMTYLYGSGGLVGFVTGGERYTYMRNLQTDIVAILDGSGNVVARYLYDPWGVPTVCNPDGTANASADFIGNKNPFRYRGYYYDRETGWYYLNSRYYDPELCRFLNADVIDAPIADLYSLTDKNLFAYCDNNPITRSDEGGHFWHAVVGAVVGAVVSTVSTVVSNLATGKKWHDGLGAAAISGALSGALSATGLGRTALFLCNAAISAAESIVTQAIENDGFEDIDYVDVAISATIDGAVSAIGTPTGKGEAKYLMHYGKNSVKDLKTKGIRRSAKYYWSQTKSYYKESLEETIKLSPITPIMDIASFHTRETFETYCLQ